MTTHCDEELFSLLTGELGREETSAVVAHLRECGECTAALISVAVAFGSLRAARRAEDELRSDRQAAVDEGPRLSEDVTAQPPLRFTPHGERRVVRLVAAAVLLIGCATAVAVSLGRSSGPAFSALASLHHMDAPSGAWGKVTVSSSSDARQMVVVTAGLPSAPANHYYEVWLLQPSSNKMLPVGLLSPSGTGTFSVSKTIMSQFSAVDISLQVNDGNPNHSPYSVLRGNVVSVA